MRAALYLRVSTKGQDLTNQRLQLEDYCERSEYEIVDVYEDIISGYEVNRPGFEKMFIDAHQKKFDILIFWALDRFSRRGAKHALAKLQELSDLGVEWTSYKEPYFNSLGPWADVIISVMATLAKVERIRISDRTKAGIQKARDNGTEVGRPKTSLDHTFKLKIIKLRKEGYSIRQIASTLDCTQWAVRKTLLEMKDVLI